MEVFLSLLTNTSVLLLRHAIDRQENVIVHLNWLKLATKIRTEPVFLNIGQSVKI